MRHVLNKESLKIKCSYNLHKTSTNYLTISFKFVAKVHLLVNSRFVTRVKLKDANDPPP